MEKKLIVSTALSFLFNISAQGQRNIHKDNSNIPERAFFLNYYKKTDLPRLISTTEFLLEQLCGIVGAVITVKVPTKTPHYAIKDLTLLPHQISTLEKSHP